MSIFASETTTDRAVSRKLKTERAMKNYCTLSDTDLLAIFNQALNAETVEDKEARRRAKVRKAKADFCNLDATDYCKFVEA